MSKRSSRDRQAPPDSVNALIKQARKDRISELDLSNRGLTELPESLSQLTHLQQLDLSDNQLTELPESIGQLTQLHYLNLINNRLTELPESIGQLTQLQYLYLNNNQLIEFPEFFAYLTKLQQLVLMSNRLTELPESIGQLTQLHYLDLGINRLTELPESMGLLSKLEKLYLDGNQLTALPDSIRNLTSLRELFLHENPSLCLPEEVLGLPWSERSAEGRSNTNPTKILEYYFRVLGGSRPLNEAKLILVGRGAVGKTSLVNQLLHAKFQEVKKTEGINITEWPIKLKGNEDVRLNVWDFGGQEIMHATHQFFLTQRSLYLLVLNGREGVEETDAEYWLKLIESFGGESPVIVVLNKIKEQPFDVNRRALRQKYPVIRDFIKTDCEDGTGIKTLREAIERETDALEHLRDPFPKSWFVIKDRLAEKKKNYMSFEEYRMECETLGERDRGAQESLAFYLHSLGIALNYREDPRLQDTHVLNPHWVTNGIYKILNSEKLERQKGVIRLNELSEILDTSEYPASMRRFLLDLMKKFELCFTFPNDDTKYLITELLDKQEPGETAAFEPEVCLNFQYHYPVLPEGLLPRFIVRTNALIEGHLRWRTGVILTFEGCRALVKADVQDKQVFISVSGPTAGRRRLLAVIRSDFDRIHQDIRNLQPQEMVPVPEHPDTVVPYQELLVMEREGETELKKVVGNRVVKLVIDDLLNGVDIEGARRRERTMYEQKQPVRLFYSYAHKDESLRNNLETHLKLLQRQGLIDTWHDRKIDAGEDWKQRIDENLERADIILLLVSADFIASDYCYEKEMSRALERHQKGEARVLPVIVRDVSWRNAPFAHLQPLPQDGKAVAKWSDRDSAWRNVSEGIEKVVREMQMKSGFSSKIKA